MDNRQPDDPAALAALQLAGQRGILLSGWAGLSSAQSPETVFFLEDVPHAWLFPRTAAWA